MIKWTKPNGNEIETNEETATIKYCKSLGWMRDTDPEPRRKSKVK